MGQFVGWEKQFLFAMFDIPVMIIAVYMNILWEIYGCENDRSVNIFAGINFLCVATSINCVVFGVLLYFMFDWIDSIVVNVLFVIAMAFTWPVELILNFEKFYFSRLLILIFTVVCCIGYQFETVQRTKRKKISCKLNVKKRSGGLTEKKIEHTPKIPQNHYIFFHAIFYLNLTFFLF